MRTVPYVTVDVFTRERFGGNPLAVVTDARGLTTAQMQALAAEFNDSETTFVLPPDDSAHTARCASSTAPRRCPSRVTRTWARPSSWLGWGSTRRGFCSSRSWRALSRSRSSVMPAAPSPRPSSRLLNRCRSDPSCRRVSRARPRRGARLRASARASVGVTFAVAEVVATAVSRAAPNVDAFRHLRAARAAELEGRLSLFCYAGPSSGEIRARMFAPLAGTWEDPATGSAGAALAALLLSLGSDETLSLDIVQGAEMGRPSRICAAARRRPDGIHATVRGGCVPVFRGEALV